MTKYCTEIIDEICDCVKRGLTQEDARIIVGISKDTFYRWRNEHSDFSDKLEKANRHFKDENLAIIQRAAKKTWQAAAWLMERKFFNEYAMRQRLEHSGTDGNPLTVHVVHYGDKPKNGKDNNDSS